MERALARAMGMERGMRTEKQEQELRDLAVLRIHTKALRALSVVLAILVTAGVTT